MSSDKRDRPSTSAPPWPPTRPPAGHPRRPAPVAAARLALAPASTLAGFRAWVLEQCPVAPGRRALKLGPAAVPRPGKATKTARFLDLVTERHGSLASIPLNRVAGISADLAPQLDLNTGAARTALRKAVLAARNGDPR